MLRERDLRPDDAHMLERALLVALREESRVALPANLRGRSDRLLSNLGESLPTEVARALAQDLVQHRLSARRAAAVKLLRRIGVGQSDAVALRRAVESHSDLGALELLTRIPGALADWDCCFLLALLPASVDGWDSSYRPALVIARLWSDDALDHAHAAIEHPVPYMRALGRVQDASRLPLVLDCVRRSRDPALLQLAASVAGRGGYHRLLRALDERVRQLGDATRSLH